MREREFILAVYPTVRGYAFVLFEGPESPFDWGVKEVRGVAKNSDVIDQVMKLIERYQPATLILENFEAKSCRRSERIVRLSHALVRLAVAARVTVKLYERQAVKRCFSGVEAQTKFQIAQAVARHIPAFQHRLPPLRLLWMSEDPRQALFDAAALGLTYYFSGKESPGEE